MRVNENTWAELRIGDVGTVFTGRTPPTERSVYFGNAFPFITPGDMRQGKYAQATQRGVSNEGAELLKRIQIPANSICVSCIGWQMGEVIMTNKPSFTNQQINSIVPNSKIEPSFIYYSLQPRKQELLSLGSGIGVRTPILNKSAFCDLKVKVPTLPVQRRIAHVLSAYDDLIENNQRRIRILEDMARSLYREWFVHFRYPDHKSALIIGSPLGDIPKDWKVKPIESFCPVVTRGVTPKYELGSGRFIINQKVNRGSELSLTDLKELEKSLVVPTEKFARFGDVLVNCLGEGTIGRVHFYSECHQDWAVDQHMSICRAESLTDSLYVYFALESQEGQGRIVSLKTGGTNMTMFNISALRSFNLVEPPLKLRVRFAELALPMMRQRQALIELTRNLRRTRDLLLPRLLSGQIALSVTPAGVENELLPQE